MSEIIFVSTTWQPVIEPVMDQSVFMRRYEDAAKLRDLVQEVQQKMDEVLARRESSAQPTQPLRLKLGQRVEHIDTGLKGIVFG